MDNSQRKPPIPDQKISETFLHFAEPLLEAHGPNMTEEQMEQPLMIAWMVWNAVVYADAAENGRMIDDVDRKSTRLNSSHSS